jgi:signal transduction histidine kinase
MLVLAIAAAALALVLRLRRSTGVQRQQMRWIMASGALLAVGLAVLLGYQLAGGPGEPWYVDLPLFLGYTSLPVCTGIAILRYRLYDIDVIINRAVVLGLLTAFVTVGYVAVVVGLGAMLGNRVLVRSWPSLVALVLVALAFQPLRQHVQRLADRLVYGQRAAPYEALAEFSRRLGHSPAPAQLLPALAEAVAGSVGASQARVALDLPDTADMPDAAGLSAAPPDAAGLSAAWPDGAERVPDVELEVRDRGEALGRIAVTMPAGRGLRPAERRLLEDLTAQAGLAFRNLRLDAELGGKVKHLGRQSAELAASRRRLMAARDGERRRIAGVIEQEVLSHLRPIPAAVEALEAGDAAAADEGLQRLEAATRAGLDALREVTQGLFPVALTRRGLVTALQSQCERRGRADILSVAPALSGRRFDTRTESAAYFCAVALMEKSDSLDLSIVDGCLVLQATGLAVDDQAIVDRGEAVGGRVVGGRVEFPVPPDQDDPGHLAADAQMAASRSVPNADLAT